MISVLRMMTPRTISVPKTIQTISVLKIHQAIPMTKKMKTRTTIV